MAVEVVTLWMAGGEFPWMNWWWIGTKSSSSISNSEKIIISKKKKKWFISLFLSFSIAYWGWARYAPYPWVKECINWKVVHSKYEVVLKSFQPNQEGILKDLMVGLLVKFLESKLGQELCRICFYMESLKNNLSEFPTGQWPSG